ncbi:MAG: acylphosphatase [Firmicutes bacterium HGW-Firmicutes-13]|nr:MAG: acylphosphatase [Firmicutes bacterium HGW-Firmicutes-13]
MNRINAHILVHGLVQGVYYRYSLKKAAVNNSVTGWARNLTDGRVEALLQGDKEKVEKVIEWAREGPPRARVSKVEVEWDVPAKIHEVFRIRSTKKTWL